MPQKTPKIARKVGRPPLSPDLKKKHVTLRLEAGIIERMNARGGNWRAALEDLLRIMYP